MKTTKKVAPDGGWGWMACFGVSLVNVSMLIYVVKLKNINFIIIMGPFTNYVT